MLFVGLSFADLNKLFLLVIKFSFKFNLFVALLENNSKHEIIRFINKKKIYEIYEYFRYFFFT